MDSNYNLNEEVGYLMRSISNYDIKINDSKLKLEFEEIMISEYDNLEGLMCQKSKIMS